LAPDRLVVSYYVSITATSSYMLSKFSIKPRLVTGSASYSCVFITNSVCVCVRVRVCSGLLKRRSNSS